MGHKDKGERNYNPSLGLQQTPEGERYLRPIRKLTPYERLLYWIQERQEIHETRFPDGMTFGPWDADYTSVFNDGTDDPHPPYTEDPILQSVFFCNVYRENDKVTAFLRENFRFTYQDDATVLLGTILLRWYNYIPTMRLLIESEIPQNLVPDRLKPTLKALEEATDMLVDVRDNGGRNGKDGQLFGGAYIIRPVVDGPAGEDVRKAEAIGDLMCRLAKDQALYADLTNTKAPPKSESIHIPGLQRGSMAYAFERLKAFQGMGQFYVYQFIGDLAYTHILRDAPDWFTWGYCGPGTARALLRLKYPTGGLPKTLPRQQAAPRDAEEQLLALQEKVNKDFTGKAQPTKAQLTKLKKGGEIRGSTPIHMRDLCNCLCEYDKYERALFNERSLKRPFAGT